MRCVKSCRSEGFGSGVNEPRKRLKTDKNRSFFLASPVEKSCFHRRPRIPWNGVLRIERPRRVRCMTTASLRDKPVRDLARLAKRQGVAGWHAMRKDELIRALVRKARSG
ncbi:MAG: Rho termination factor N-terminal domain-containing protein, partial [Planctomycetaceae bacterium]